MEHLQLTYPLELPDSYQVRADVNEIRDSVDIFFCIPEKADYVVTTRTSITARKRVYYMCHISGGMIP